MKINLELDHHEALMILDPIQDGAQADRITAATSQGSTAEWHGVRAQVRQRIATRIVDELYPQEDPERVILREQYELGML